MFNHFKKNEQVSGVESEPVILDHHELAEALPEETIDLKLEALSDYFSECEKNGIDLTKEMVEQEINERLGINAEELLGEQITNPEISLTHQEIISEIKRVMEQKAESKGTPLSFLRDTVFKSKFSKAAVMSLLVGLKINSMQAAEKADVKDVKSKQEFKKADTKSSPDGKTYQAKDEDFSDPDKPIVISATSNFETNKADLKDSKVLESKLDAFFSTINTDNFEILMAQDWVVKGSSDERRTNWEGGNEGLTKARIESVKTAILKVLNKHNFSKQLSEDQIKKLLTKEIYQSYPKSGEEKGVTYITNLDNPETGEKYTAEEVESLKTKNPAKYNKLLDKCRYTNFELKAKNKVFENENYDIYYVLIDNSPSMEDNKKDMAREMQEMNIQKTFLYANFSDKVGNLEVGSDSKAVANKILKMPKVSASSTELAMSSAITLLSRVDASNANLIKSGKKLSKTVMFIATDETLQDVNRIEELKVLSERNNFDIKFIFFYQDGQRTVKVGLDEIQEQIDLNNIFKAQNGRVILSNFSDEYGRKVF
jgi:hypothetical protein